MVSIALLIEIKGKKMLQKLLLDLNGVSVTQTSGMLIFINLLALTSKKIKAPNVQSGNEGKKIKINTN